MAALLGRWIETLGERVHLVGNSMGGQVAIHLAARRPELVRSLVLVDSTGIPFDLEPRPHLENLVLPPGIVSFTRVVARDLFRAGPTSFAVAFARLLRDDARPLMRRLTMPVLLLWGEFDPLVPLRYAQQIAAEVPHARLAVVPCAGHVPMWDNPEAFNRDLLEFLDEVEGKPQGEPPRPAFTWGISGWTDGIAHRQAGSARDIVLVHGLGVSSATFERLARALHARGWSPVAPDIRGFGESENAPAAGPRAHAEWLAGWADALQITGAFWLGHSTGCNTVAHLAAMRPDLVRTAIFLSPVWSARRGPLRRFVDLSTDAFREPLGLIPVVARSYVRAGLGRIVRTFRAYSEDSRARPPLPGRFLTLAAAADPVLDAGFVRSIDPDARLDLPGAHAVHFSHPAETAERIDALA